MKLWLASAAWPQAGSITMEAKRVYVIIMKLHWGRSKDIEDVRGVIAVQSNALDWNYIHEWTTEHGTLSRLNEIRNSLPPTA